MNTAQPEIILDYLYSQGLSPTVPERFWPKVDKTSSLNGCWLWTGSTNHGYGILNSGMYVPVGAHVVSYVLNKGPIPKGALVLHKCPVKHNRRCCNPNHLELGDKRQNAIDSIEQGTNSLCSRMDACRMKLTKELAEEIRAQYGGKRGDQAALGRKYGVTRHAIRLIVHRKVWV